jgi:hypothetical protein
MGTDDRIDDAKIEEAREAEARGGDTYDPNTHTCCNCCPTLIPLAEEEDSECPECRRAGGTAQAAPLC